MAQGIKLTKFPTISLKLLGSKPGYITLFTFENVNVQQSESQLFFEKCG